MDQQCTPSEAPSGIRDATTQARVLSQVPSLIAGVRWSTAYVHTWVGGDEAELPSWGRGSWLRDRHTCPSARPRVHRSSFVASLRGPIRNTVGRTASLPPDPLKKLLRAYLWLLIQGPALSSETQFLKTREWGVDYHLDVFLRDFSAGDLKNTRNDRYSIRL